MILFVSIGVGTLFIGFVMKLFIGASSKKLDVAFENEPFNSGSINPKFEPG